MKLMIGTVVNYHFKSGITAVYAAVMPDFYLKFHDDIDADNMNKWKILTNEKILSSFIESTVKIGSTVILKFEFEQQSHFENIII